MGAKEFEKDLRGRLICPLCGVRFWMSSRKSGSPVVKADAWNCPCCGEKLRLPEEVLV